MIEYKIYELDKYDNFLYLSDILTEEQKNRHNKLWCFHNKKHFLDKLTYECERGDIDDACFNMYANMTITQEIYTNKHILPPSIIPSMYTLITNQKIYNRCYWYAIKIIEDGKHIDTTCVMAINNGNYYHTYGKSYDADGWPKFIPEEYKSQCIYKEMQTPFIPDELNDSNIELKDDKLYVEGKEINEYGYYANENDMYEFCNNYKSLKQKLYIHTPFNAINLNAPNIESKVKQYIGKYLTNLEIYIVGDNTQLSNITNIRIGGIGFGDAGLNLINKDQQHCIIRKPAVYNSNTLYRWKTPTYTLNT